MRCPAARRWTASFLLDRLGLKGALAAAAALYCAGLLGDSYYGLISNVPPLKAAVNAAIDCYNNEIKGGA